MNKQAEKEAEDLKNDHQSGSSSFQNVTIVEKGMERETRIYWRSLTNWIGQVSGSENPK